MDLCGTRRVTFFTRRAIIFRSVTTFELVTQTYTKILVILGEIREISQNPREMKCRFNLNRFVLKLTKFNRQFNDVHQFLCKIEPSFPFVNFCQLCITSSPKLTSTFHSGSTTKSNNKSSDYMYDTQITK